MTLPRVTTLLVLACIAACDDEPAPQSSVPAPSAATSAPATTSDEPASMFATRRETPENAPVGAQVEVQEFHQNGQLATRRTELVLADGKRVRVGPMQAYHENGVLRIEGGYDQEGRLAGHWKYFDDAGRLEREGDYELGMRTGEWVDFHPNGQKRSQGFVHANMNEGAWTYWHANGRTMAEGSYINNQRDGVWLFFDAEGQPDKQFSGTYRMGSKLP